MKYGYFAVLILAFLIGCQRPTDPNPIKPTEVTEPPLVDILAKNDSLYFDEQILYLYTSSPDVSVSCAIAVTNNNFPISRIREYGFSLSATDSSLSIRNPAHLRFKASTTTNPYRFAASLSGLEPGRAYYLDPYIILKDGRVNYGRYNALRGTRWNRHIDGRITQFTVRNSSQADYQSARVIKRANVPIQASAYQKFFFAANNTLFALNNQGQLFQYKADQDQWTAKQKLTIDPEGQFNGSQPTVFSTQNKGYVLFSYPFGQVKTMFAEYDPGTDTWTNLPIDEKKNFSGDQFLYQRNGRAVFKNPYVKRISIFDAGRRDITTTTSSLLDFYRQFVPNGETPYAYYADFTYTDTTRAAVLRLTTYDDINDRFGTSIPVSTRFTDTSPTVATTLGQDVLFGLGTRTAPIATSRLYTEQVLQNDDLIRYSPATGKITGRYNIAAIRRASPDPIWGQYKTFTLANRVFVVDPANSNLWEIQLD